MENLLWVLYSLLRVVEPLFLPPPYCLAYVVLSGYFARFPPFSRVSMMVIAQLSQQVPFEYVPACDVDLRGGVHGWRCVRSLRESRTGVCRCVFLAATA